MCSRCCCVHSSRLKNDAEIGQRTFFLVAFRWFFISKSFTPRFSRVAYGRCFKFALFFCLQLRDFTGFTLTFYLVFVRSQFIESRLRRLMCLIGLRLVPLHCFIEICQIFAQQLSSVNFFSIRGSLCDLKSYPFLAFLSLSEFFLGSFLFFKSGCNSDLLKERPPIFGSFYCFSTNQFLN